MQRTAIFLVCLALASGCVKKEEQQAADTKQTPPAGAMRAAAPANQDISTKALAEIDPAVAKYQEGVDLAKKKFDAKSSANAKLELLTAYLNFGDYMTYESPVSPRQGKYRRALLEYRHALQLDPGNQKAQTEIAQIEDIYKSMGRAVPSDPL